MTPSFILINLFFSLLIAFLVKRYSHKPLPSERCSHKTATPTIGGVIFAMMFFLNYFFFANEAAIIPPLIFVSVFCLFIVGIIDDHHYLSYKIRLLIHLFVGLCIALNGYTVQLPTFIGENIYGADIVLTIILVVGLINACNFFDGLNGLLSGCIILLLGYAYFIMGTPLHFISLIIIPLFVFYIFNFPKAQFFMGDVGSTFLGFFLAFLSLKNQSFYMLENQTALIHKGLIYTLTPMMFAWFDILFTLLRRIVEGKHLFSPWRDYLFHHLQDIGYSHTKTSIIYYHSVVLMSTLTYFCMNGTMPFLAGFSIYCVLQIIFVVFILKKHYQIKNSAPLIKGH